MNIPCKGSGVIPKFITIFLLISADCASKALVQTKLEPGESLVLIGNILRITYVQNKSGFSWFVPDLPAWVQTSFQLLLFVIVLAALPIYLFYTSRRHQTPWVSTAFVCLTAALLGHTMIDVFFPYTVDFLQVDHSPSANLADLYSYVGIGALLIETW